MIIDKKRYIVALLLLALIFIPTLHAEDSKPPRLVVNIIISSMRAGDLEKYRNNFCEGGIARLIGGGKYYTNASYDYMLTSTAAGIATYATGTLPSIHGVIGQRWYNYVDSSLVSLINDSKYHPVKYSTGSGQYSPHRLTTPTMGDMLLWSDSESKQISVAVDALSAIVVNGKAGVAYWAEKNKTHWTTSSAYLYTLPEWVERYNEANSNRYYMLPRWTPIYEAKSYINDEVAVVEDVVGKSTKLLSDVNLSLANSDIGRMCYTPAGNTMLLEFASNAVAQERLGADDHPDILNIVLDTPRYIAETYGTESIEYEDMLYRLDRDLSEFLTFLYAQVKSPEDIIVVLCSDHGTAPSYNPVGAAARERFNTRQMEVIVNAFLGAHYGSDSYVLGFANNSIYLNHSLILSKRLSIDAIREEVAVFMLQLRGVRNAISTTALRNTSFADGRSRLMQRSFYPTRSGDVIIDFMPGWTIEDNSIRTSSDGGYNYDRYVPLVIYGGDATAEIIERSVSICEVAPTICNILKVDRPWATEDKALEEFDKTTK